MVTNASILGLFIGIIMCLYIHNFIQQPSLSNFIEPFIIFSFIGILYAFKYSWFFGKYYCYSGSGNRSLLYYELFRE
jgi:hypothetical protein